jgi:O-antigen/teichoic acid export membrane protein
LTASQIGLERAPDSQAHWRKREVGLAVQNAAKLGGSLAVTWGIGLLVRLYLPRFLGPERFGVLNFAEAFSTTAFVLLGFGLDTYVRKEVSVKPGHASDFIGGVLLLRALLALFVFGGMELFLNATARSEEVRALVRIYGLAQLFVIGSTTSAGLLHAKGNVNEMSVLTIVTKIVWGIGIGLALLLDLGLWAYGLALAVSEGLKSSLLFAFARKHLDLQLRLDLRATWRVLVASAPFYIAGISTTIYNKIDVSILSLRANDHEVGWYGAASALAGLTLLLTPLISWVMMPLFARAAAVSESELVSMVRRALELILTLTIPVALIMALGAELWIGIVFGAEFAPSALALRVLAPVFVVMYVSIVCWCALTMLNRTWALTAIFASGIVVSPLLNTLLIERGMAAFGPGGGGAACATAMLGTELWVVTPMLLMMGRRVADTRLLKMLGKSALGVALTVTFDVITRPHLGLLRLPLDAVLYAAFVLGTRAVNVAEIVEWTKMALRTRREQKLDQEVQ